MPIKFRRSAEWMEQTDDRILEHIQEEGWSSPTIMVSLDSIEAPKGTLSDRCQMLSQAGFLAPIHEDMYELTTWGQQYLSGKIDAEHQPRPNIQKLKG